MTFHQTAVRRPSDEKIPSRHRHPQQFSLPRPPQLPPPPLHTKINLPLPCSHTASSNPPKIFSTPFNRRVGGVENILGVWPQGLAVSEVTAVACVSLFFACSACSSRLKPGR